jgi:hypothetical protein
LEDHRCKGYGLGLGFCFKGTNLIIFAKVVHLLLAGIAQFLGFNISYFSGGNLKLRSIYEGVLGNEELMANSSVGRPIDQAT